MKVRILCIDDSKSVHAYLKSCVEEVASDFKSAYDGEQALELLALNSDSFDLIFLDWEMPKMTGPEVLVELKRRGLTTPIVMLTSKNDASDMMQVLSKGAAEYILKPFTKDIILDKMSMALGTRR